MTTTFTQNGFLSAARSLVALPQDHPPALTDVVNFDPDAGVDLYEQIEPWRDFAATKTGLRIEEIAGERVATMQVAEAHHRLSEIYDVESGIHSLAVLWLGVCRSGHGISECFNFLYFPRIKLLPVNRKIAENPKYGECSTFPVQFSLLGYEPLHDSIPREDIP